jgi:hypothetical protein
MTIKSKISDSAYVANIPEVTNFSGDFVYNYYTEDERVTELPLEAASVSLDKVPRYVKLNWDPLPTSNFKFIKGHETTDVLLSRLVSEDSGFSPMYLSQNFSDITSIKQGSADLANYSSLNQKNIESKTKLSKEALKSIIEKGGVNSSEFKEGIKLLASAYDAISDLPIDSLGLRVYDNEGNLTDDRDFLKTLASSLTLNLKVHKLAIPDFFNNSQKMISSGSLGIFQSYYQDAKSFNAKYPQQLPQVFAFKRGSADDAGDQLKADDPPRIKGYLLTRYKKMGDGLKKEFVEYLNDPLVTSYNDREVLYGVSYVYTLSVVAELDLLGLSNDDKESYEFMTINLVSRTSSIGTTCVEFTPPPPPIDIKFVFDYQKNNVSLMWDFPVNPQHDIKQFQVFRRKSIKNPFELIAQYGFDKSIPGLPDNQRYKTGEVVDANNYENLSPDLKQLVKQADGPVYRHVDKDFVVDSEFFETTSYIYALCSVDAHGMISNYSSQYRVTFDPFRNKLKIEMICDEGSPRAYPNMNLKIDAFKDSINTGGDETKQLQIYFTPEYLNVVDERGKNFRVVEAQKPGVSDKPYYLMQIINLDNQIAQIIKINVLDPNQLTDDN